MSGNDSYGEPCLWCHQPKGTINPWVLESLAIAELDRGADAGCDNCIFRKKAISSYETNPHARVVFQDSVQRFMLGRRRFYEIFKLEGCRAERYRNIQTGRLMSDSTSSDDTLSTIKSWLQECTNSHIACRQATLGRTFAAPKRILDLRTGRVVLKESVELDRYACLSHCWGRNQSLVKTVRATVESFKEDIPWPQLSRTFQDAVSISRRLGIYYIWIDSLCIIQDSSEDWDEESVKMADIYGNAYITIAATGSSDGNGGCYRKRDPGYVSGQVVVDGLVYTRQAMPPFDGSPARATADDRPLLKRGWVYQEMALSRRVLHFCRQEVIWQCRTCRKSESGSNDDPSPDIPIYDLQRDGRDMEQSWHDIVHQYSHLDLTKSKDRLPALSAIAQRTADARENDRFLAGLWEKSLFSDLLWQSYHQGGSERAVRGRPDGFRGPSWSWVSVRMRVRWWSIPRNDIKRPLICTRLLSIDVTPEGSLYLGRFLCCDIMFRAPLIPTTMGALSDCVWMKNIPGERRGRFEGTCFNGLLCVYQYYPDYVYTDGETEGDHGRKDAEVFILPLMVGMRGAHLIYGIVVIMRPDTATHERIGAVILQYVKRAPPSKPALPSRPVDEVEWELVKDLASSSHPSTPDWIDEYLSHLPASEVRLR